MKSKRTGPRQTRPSRSTSPRTPRQTTSRIRTSGVTNIEQERLKRMTDAERAKYRHKKRLEKQKKTRIRRLKQIRAILLLLFIIFIVTSIVRAISKGKNSNSQKEKSPDRSITETLDQKEGDQSLTETDQGLPQTQVPAGEAKNTSGFSPNIQGYVQTVSATNLYEAPVTDSESTQIPVGTYLPQYGHVGGWVKVYQKGKAGYVQAANLKVPSDENTFFVKDGVLLVNRQYTLPADFDPGLLPETQKAFDEMKAAAKKDGITLKIGSGYRSYEYQVEVHDKLVADAGVTRANQVSAQPGHSEHQTGQALDIIGSDPSTNITQSFHDTKESKWLQENAYKYGFHLRYMEGKENITGYEYESWHYRYLGTDLATQLFLTGQCLEEYLGVAEEQPEIFKETVGISMEGTEAETNEKDLQTESDNQ